MSRPWPNSRPGDGAGGLGRPGQQRVGVRGQGGQGVGAGAAQWAQVFGLQRAGALLDPRACPVILRSVLASLSGIVRHGRPAPPSRPSGGRLGLPADVLISPDGQILAVHDGQHAADQWPVSQVLALAAAAPPREAYHASRDEWPG